MKRDFTMKRRDLGKLPPEKLYEILCRIYPQDIADEKYVELTALKPPKEVEP